MARSPEKTADRSQKCKPPGPDSPPELMGVGGFERPWHQPFLDDAMRTADIPAALGRASVGWGDYLRSRREHLVFMVACLELDMVVRHALLIRLESMAAAGDPKSIKLLNGGLAEIRRTLSVAGVDPAGPSGSLPTKVPELHQVGSIGVPSGPCAACARGLHVHRMDDEGRYTSFFVRHEVMEGIEGIPEYPGYPDPTVVYGHVPATGKIRPRFWEVGEDGQIKPEYLVPPLSGPTRLERWEAYYRAHPERVNGPLELFLEVELPYGQTPAPGVADRYELSVDVLGRSIHRLKPGDKGEVNREVGHGG